MIRFEFIDQTSRFLNDIIKLGSKNSNTLGFMPVGGFRDHAKKRWIIIAYENDVLAGYLLFRLGTKKSRISITHLCIDFEFRGRHIATGLIDELKKKYSKSFAGILLSCRKDYIEANVLWEKYGFVSKKEIRSRSTDERYLIKWWYDFNQSDLFSYCDQDTQRIRVLLDANIIIKLRDENVPEHDEVKALLADWLTDEVDYFYAPELFNEIQRDSDRLRADKTRKFIQETFKEARHSKDDVKVISNELQQVLTGNSTNDNSDRKQLAECIASGLEYFITGDGPILTKKHIIQKKFDITILNPVEFLLAIDKLTNTSSYNPSRLSGALQVIKKVETDEIETLIDRFLFKRFSETKHSLRQKVNYVLQNSKKGEVRTVCCSENGDLAFWGHVISEDTIEIPFFRFAEIDLSKTLFTQLIAEIIGIAINNAKPFIKILDNYYYDYQESTLIDLGFKRMDCSWHKITIRGLVDSSNLIKDHPYITDFIDGATINRIHLLENTELKNKLLYELERKLFPLKFSNLDIPCYIIPIKPHWASQLFDKYSSHWTLFGANPQKIWNRENVYYRNVKPVTERPPARILWYASTEKGFLRQNGVVATSYLDEVTIDLVKVQHSRYKRYGIYEWKDIYKLARNNIDNPVKSLKFSDTEVFKTIIPLKKINEILLGNNRKRNTFTSPLEVNKNVFNEVYLLNL